jgi:manganese transport protein
MSEARPIAAPKTASEEREPTLAGAYRTIAVQGTGFKRFAAFLGPGYMVATGYMDPGNWATALAAGSRFGTALLFIVIASSLMAIVLQALSARLAIATGLDLAQICRREFGRPAAFCLWLIAETSIIATDLAEVIGTAIGIKLLTGLPLWAGIVITGLDVFLVLGLQSVGFRKLEGLVVSLLIVIALCFALQLALHHRGQLPTQVGHIAQALAHALAQEGRLHVGQPVGLPPSIETALTDIINSRSI